MYFQHFWRQEFLLLLYLFQPKPKSSSRRGGRCVGTPCTSSTFSWTWSSFPWRSSSSSPLFSSQTSNYHFCVMSWGGKALLPLVSFNFHLLSRQLKEPVVVRRRRRLLLTGLQRLLRRRPRPPLLRHLHQEVGLNFLWWNVIINEASAPARTHGQTQTHTLLKKISGKESLLQCQSIKTLKLAFFPPA